MLKDKICITLAVRIIFSRKMKELQKNKIKPRRKAFEPIVSSNCKIGSKSITSLKRSSLFFLECIKNA